MTINTLEYIHRLLKDEEARTREDYRCARQLQHEYEENDSVGKADVRRQEEAADELMRKHSDASNALADFESHEW